jgi:hypothetical protein
LSLVLGSLLAASCSSKGLDNRKADGGTGEETSSAVTNDASKGTPDVWGAERDLGSPLAEDTVGSASPDLARAIPDVAQALDSTAPMGRDGTAADGPTDSLSADSLGARDVAASDVGHPDYQVPETAREALGASDGTGLRPAGYFMASDWGVQNLAWAGCTWTLGDNREQTSTVVMPLDFTKNQDSGNVYRFTGTVGVGVDSFAMLGFNLSEPIFGDPDQCAYRQVDRNDGDLPTVTFSSKTNGIAIAWEASGAAAPLRVELLGPNGRSDPNDRWCADITDATGPTFVRYTSFYVCDGGGRYSGEPVASVAFIVPGQNAPQPFDFTIKGFAIGNVLD